MSWYTMKKLNNGYVYVASLNPLYYELAILSAQSLKDIHPQSHVTLFTHDKFVDDRAEQLFDNIVTNIPVHRRAKMWCMARTPYDQTFYNDCDSVIVHPDISKVFDNLDDKIYMTKNLVYTVSRKELEYIDKDRKWFPYFHGAVAWYQKNDANIEFIDTWWRAYVKQLYSPWPHGDWAFEIWQGFDMFTLWSMLNSFYPEYDKFKDRVVEGDRRFNCVLPEGKQSESVKSPVVYQIPRDTYCKFDYWPKVARKLQDAPTFYDEHYDSEDSIEFN